MTAQLPGTAALEDLVLVKQRVALEGFLERVEIRAGCRGAGHGGDMHQRVALVDDRQVAAPDDQPRMR